VFTIDTSVWVNADSPAEPHQPESRALLDLLFSRRVTIVLPTLLAAELAGAISRTRGDVVLAQDMATAILGLPTRKESHTRSGRPHARRRASRGSSAEFGRNRSDAESVGGSDWPKWRTRDSRSLRFAVPS
jgi:hypothetical protein